MKHLFRDREDLEAVEVPDFLDVTFLRQFLIGIESTANADVRVVGYFDVFRAAAPEDDPLLEPPRRFLGDSNAYCYAATTLSTNIRNSLATQLERRVRTFLSRLQRIRDFGDEDRRAMLFDAMGWERPLDMTVVLNAPEALELIVLVPRLSHCDCEYAALRD